VRVRVFNRVSGSGCASASPIRRCICADTFTPHRPRHFCTTRALVAPRHVATRSTHTASLHHLARLRKHNTRRRPRKRSLNTSTPPFTIAGTMSYRAANITYLKYVNITGQFVRNCIKPEVKAVSVACALCNSVQCWTPRPPAFPVPDLTSFTCALHYCSVVLPYDDSLFSFVASHTCCSSSQPHTCAQPPQQELCAARSLAAPSASSHKHKHKHTPFHLSLDHAFYFCASKGLADS
jgi:hypothetical protein